MAWVRRVWRVVPSLLVAIAVFCLAGEAGTRAFNLVDRLNGYPRRLFVATDEPDLPYVLRPGFDAVVRHGPYRVHVRTNALGLRGPEVAARPAPGVHRILVLGDSATFGEGLAVEEAFPALLERELTQRTDGRWEVLNAGIEGYNTVAELAWLRTRGLALGPRTVVVAFNLNDIDDPPVMGPLGVLTHDRSRRVRTWSIANRSEFYLLVRWLILTRGRGLPEGVPPPPPEPGTESGPFSAFDLYVSRLRKQYWAKPTDGRWQAMVEALASLSEVARSRGLRLVIAILPDGDQIGVAAPDLVPQEKLRAVCGERGLDCLDLRPAFAAAAAATPGERLFFDPMHPNAAGQQIVARALADHLLAAE